MQVLSSSPTLASNSMLDLAKNDDAGSPRDTQKQLLSRLEPYLTENQIGQVLDAGIDDYSVENVANRIVDFVASGLAAAESRGASAERLESLYQSALKGVARGFAEAKTILEESGLFSASARSLVADTEAATFDKLAEIAPALNKAPPVSESLQINAQYRESMKINLVTQDGDRVQVKFVASEKGSFSQDSDSLSLASSFSSSYQFKVKGDLDAEEITAITNLLDSVSGVADQFYAGRLDQAFQQAVELEMDPNQLARFDLDLQMSARIEVREYQKIEEVDFPARSIAQQIQNWLEPLEQLSQQPALASFMEPSNSLRELLEGAMDIRGKEKGLPPGLERLLSERIA